MGLGKEVWVKCSSSHQAPTSPALPPPALGPLWWRPELVLRESQARNSEEIFPRPWHRESVLRAESVELDELSGEGMARGEFSEGPVCHLGGYILRPWEGGRERL